MLHRIQKPPKNFAGDHPVNLLTDADVSYIANEAVNILSDEQRTQDAINQFFDMFGELVDGIRTLVKPGASSRQICGMGTVDDFGSL